jgi:hypothetical protein
MPQQMLVGASASAIYGFKLRSRRKEPHDLVFQVSRDHLDVNVHARVNVRVLELVNQSTGAKIELEGIRLPITHSHELIEYLVGADALSAADADASADPGST